MLRLFRSVFALLSLVAVSYLTACSDPSTPAPESANQELSEQIESLQQQMKLLRLDISAIRQAVTEIHRGSVVKRNNAPNVVIVKEVLFGSDDPIVGSPEAQVAIVEFSDFQCPYCGRFHKQVFPEIKKRYIDSGKVKYIFRDFPLGFHAEAHASAVVANCASKQDAFLALKDALFANQRNLGSELYVKLAAANNLDQDKFVECIADKSISEAVELDLTYGQSIGVHGTPTFFIGRVDGEKIVDVKRLVGAQSYNAFVNALEPLLDAHIEQIK